MSTYWYFECTEHDPPIVSNDEVAQHTGDANFSHAIELAQSRPLPEKDFTYADRGREYFDRNARHFLYQHPKCALDLLSEYGDRRILGKEPS